MSILKGEIPLSTNKVLEILSHPMEGRRAESKGEKGEREREVDSLYTLLHADCARVCFTSSFCCPFILIPIYFGGGLQVVKVNSALLIVPLDED